jgi:Na+-transporting methylmalonyl-CoA/oxaloacetate decarboxylase gamma subunit
MKLLFLLMLMAIIVAISARVDRSYPEEIEAAE